jgi:hypothetical protein
MLFSSKDLAVRSNQMALLYTVKKVLWNAVMTGYLKVTTGQMV